MTFHQHREFEEVTLEEAARILNVKRSLVRNRVEDDILPSRIDKSDFRRIRRIPLVAVEAYREPMIREQRYAAAQSMIASGHADMAAFAAEEFRAET